MHRLWCGDSLIKVVAPAKTPDAKPPGGGIPAALGYRYWTMTISNLSELMSELKAADVKVVIDETEIRPGVTIAIVEDPDGNLVEFVGG
jgi:catechol 2,3-dioxygenase-like lactoylglutathione lyase family enzyme